MMPFFLPFTLLPCHGWFGFDLELHRGQQTGWREREAFTGLAVFAPMSFAPFAGNLNRLCWRCAFWAVFPRQEAAIHFAIIEVINPAGVLTDLTGDWFWREDSALKATGGGDGLRPSVRLGDAVSFDAPNLP